MDNILDLINGGAAAPPAAAPPAAAPPVADPAEIAKAIALICEPGEVYEVRAKGAILWKRRDGSIGKRGMANGYYIDRKAMVRGVVECAEKLPEAVWLSINPCKPGLLGHSKEHINTKSVTGCEDKDITARRVLFLDFGAWKEIEKLSSTDAEHDAALDRARRCREWLTSLGWPEPIYADSSNGGHLLYHLNLPNEPEALALVEKIYDAINAKLGEKWVDRTCANASRMCKIYGTRGMKGDATNERPHRLSHIIEAPETLTPVTVEQLKAVAATAPERHSQPPKSGKGQKDFNAPYDMAAFITRHPELVVKREPEQDAAFTRWKLETCPLCWESEGNPALALHESGAPGFSCFRATCPGNEEGPDGKKHPWRALLKQLGEKGAGGGNQHIFATREQAYDALSKIIIKLNKPFGQFYIVPSRELVSRDTVSSGASTYYFHDEEDKLKKAALPYADGLLGALPVTVDEARCLPGVMNGTIVECQENGVTLRIVSTWPGWAVTPREPKPGELDWWDLLLDQCVENLPLPRIKKPDEPGAAEKVKKYGPVLALSRMLRPSRGHKIAGKEHWIEKWDQRYANRIELERICAWPFAHPEDFAMNFMAYLQSDARGIGKA
jgi:hypothetical protein